MSQAGTNLRQTRKDRELEEMTGDRAIAVAVYENAELNSPEGRALLVRLANVATLEQLKAAVAQIEAEA